MEPLSEAALGVLRDKTIADYLLEHCCRTTAFSKLDHGQKLLDHITQQFKLAGLPVPQTYMKSVDNVCDRVKKFMADKSGHFKKEVDANCELVRYVLALRGIDTKKGLLAAIASAAAPATAPAADAPTREFQWRRRAPPKFAARTLPRRLRRQCSSFRSIRGRSRDSLALPMGSAQPANASGSAAAAAAVAAAAG